MDDASPIERTTKFATSVPDLPAAWAFIMSRIEEVGPDPQVSISPTWRITMEGEDLRRFEVTVSGMVHA